VPLDGIHRKIRVVKRFHDTVKRAAAVNDQSFPETMDSLVVAAVVEK
jgi:hypothetical protein